MPNLTPALVVVVNAVVVVLGGLVTSLAHRAYRRTGTPRLGWLTVGFGLITVSLLLLGGGYQAVVDQAASGVFAGGLLASLGFGFLVYSLYMQPESQG